MITRKQFLIGGLSSAAASLLLGGCTDDGGRTTTSLDIGDPTGDDLDTDVDTTETESDSGDTTTTETESTESTTESTEDTTESSSEDTTTESTEDTTESSSEDTTEDTTDTDTDTGEPVCPQGASGTIIMNHSHQLLISQADIEAGVAKNYNIQNGANHNHVVSLTAGDFVQLALGNTVIKESSYLQNHSHDVHIACLL